MPITLNGTTGIVSPSVTGTPVIGGLVSGTAVTASGTSVDFTGIPSWVKRVTVMFSGVSLSGTSSYLVQLGDSGGVENTGYLSAGVLLRDATAVAAVNYTTGFGIGSVSAAYLMNGSMSISNPDASQCHRHTLSQWSCVLCERCNQRITDRWYQHQGRRIFVRGV